MQFGNLLLEKLIHKPVTLESGQSKDSKTGK